MSDSASDSAQSPEPGSEPASKPGSAVAPDKRAIAAWCLYDWANSAFPTVVSTFIFASYFTKAVAPTPEQGTAWWGWTMGAAGLLIALLGPLLGAMADQSGRRKPYLAAATLVTICASAALWFVTPDASSIPYALAMVLIASVAFEVALVFYNAMLPAIAPRAMLGRVSGWAWGLGYAGGLACLAIALVGFAQAQDPWFGLDKDNAEHIRASVLLVAVWYALFCLPLFLLVPDVGSGLPRPKRALAAGLAQLKATLAQVRQYADIARYLLARMLYTDGLNTLFSFGGIYAAGTFGMEFEQIVIFGIATNVTAGIGAFGFAWVDDRLGSKTTIVIALVCMMVLGSGLLIVEDVTWFWVLALGLAVFFGPVQAASRSLMARKAPEHLRTEMFGLYALSGKITAFLGPIVLGWVTLLADSQRAGMATVLVFLGVGLVILIKGVKAEKGGASIRQAYP